MIQAGSHNLAVILDGNIAQRLGITDEELFTRVTQSIRQIPGVKNVYAYELTTQHRYHDTKIKMEGTDSCESSQ